MAGLMVGFMMTLVCFQLPRRRSWNLSFNTNAIQRPIKSQFGLFLLLRVNRLRTLASGLLTKNGNLGKVPKTMARYCLFQLPTDRCELKRDRDSKASSRMLCRVVSIEMKLLLSFVSRSMMKE